MLSLLRLHHEAAREQVAHRYARRGEHRQEDVLEGVAQQNPPRRLPPCAGAADIVLAYVSSIDERVIRAISAAGRQARTHAGRTRYSVEPQPATGSQPRRSAKIATAIGPHCLAQQAMVDQHASDTRDIRLDRVDARTGIGTRQRRSGTTWAKNIARPIARSSFRIGGSGPASRSRARVSCS